MLFFVAVLIHIGLIKFWCKFRYGCVFVSRNSSSLWENKKSVEEISCILSTFKGQNSNFLNIIQTLLEMNSTLYI